MSQPSERRDHLTFRGNLRSTRYGWLRLTPAYSVHLVDELIDRNWTARSRVLDPFCGTGTTATVCAERGIACDTTDINPFLLWLAAVKTRRYAADELAAFVTEGAAVARAMRRLNGRTPWTPPLHQIEKWWSPSALAALGRGMTSIRALESRCEPKLVDLLKIAFCRVLIDRANVSFAHQSMSFKRGASGRAPDEAERVAESFTDGITAIAGAARSPIRRVPRAIHCDARDLVRKLEPERYGCVITSPPYPNRMSYIRELRPYMYWLGYLADGRAAGELDWEAIGGTWGSATSNVAKWTPSAPLAIRYPRFSRITREIGHRSAVLGRYVTKYFHDMLAHCRSLHSVVARGGSVHYIVGNSKFYDVLLPVEEIYAAMFEAVGFERIGIETIRKRTSKKELYEFVVSASKPKRSSR